MKILHIDTRPDWRGGQFQVLLTMRGLRALGQEVQLLARRDSLLGERASAEKLSVHFFSAPWIRWQATLCLREILSQQRFDIVHAHDPHALTAAWLARAHRKSVLIVSRRVAYPIRNSLARARYRAAGKILAVSRFVARSVIASGIPEGNVGVVYDGVEIPPAITPEQRAAARALRKAEAKEILLVCVGYLLPEKGQELLLRALPLVREKFADCRAVLAGDGPCRGRLERMARDLGVGNAVIFTGFEKDVESIYRATDIFVFPSLAEPLGSSLLAAMAQGLPAVAVANGGVPEIIESGQNGLLTAANAAAMAEAICALLGDPERAARIGRAARATIIQKFSAQALAERTLEEYRKSLSAHPPG